MAGAPTVPDRDGRRRRDAWNPLPSLVRPFLDARCRRSQRGSAGGFQPHVEGCFLDAVPEQRLVFTTALSEGWRPAEPWLALTAIMTFTPEGEGTRYTASVLHKSSADSRKHEDMGFHEGWGRTTDQLAALVEQFA